MEKKVGICSSESFWFFTILFLCFFTAQSQELKLLEGRIIADSLMESSVHVVNRTQRTGVVNQADGVFHIKVKQQDTIFFTSVQYEPKQIIVSPEIFQNGKMEVSLSSVELDEVRISDKKLSGYIERDVKAIKTTSLTQFGMGYLDKPRATPAERRLYTATSANVDLLINVLSGKLKKLKKHKENEDLQMLVEKAVYSLPEKFFSVDMELTEDDLINFLYFCAETDPGFRPLLSRNRPLELIEYYQEMLPKYEEEKAGEGR